MSVRFRTCLGRIALVFAALVLHLPTPANAEVVYVPRSELFSYMIAEQVGDIAKAYTDLAAMNLGAQLAYAKLDSLRSELATCGDCSKKAQLLGQIRGLQDHVIQEHGPICAGVDAVRILIKDDPRSYDAVMKITGQTKVCESFKREVEILQFKVAMSQAQTKLDQRLKAGDLSAYSDMGDWIRNEYAQSRAVSPADRQYLSCHYFQIGARKGDIGSWVALPDKCPLDRKGYQGTSQALQQCLKQGKPEHRCAHALDQIAEAYSSASRKPRRPASDLPVDDQEALRLRLAVLTYWEQQSARSPQDRIVRESLERARQHVAILRHDQTQAPKAGSAEREAMLTGLQTWCEGIRERSGRAEIWTYDCPCFVRTAEQHVNEGRLNWARTQREQIFDFGLVQACMDRSATADAWVAHQRTQLPSTPKIDTYLACAHKAIARDLPVAQLSQRRWDGWRGDFEPSCGSVETASRPAKQSVPPRANLATQRASPQTEARGRQANRRCEQLREQLARSQEKHDSDPKRYGGQHRSLTARFEKACGD